MNGFRLLRALCALLAMLALVGAGCGRPAAPPDAPPATPPPSPQAAAIDVSTPAAYQALLDQTDRDLDAAFAAIREATSVPELAQAVLASAGVASASAEKLTTSGPVPPSVAADNAALADGLGQLGRELAFLSQQVNLQVICAGPTAYGAIGTAPSMPGLREVAASLGTATSDRPAFRWGASLPPPVDAKDNRLPNGARPIDRRAPDARGEGVLEVRNQGDTDAVVVLAERDSPEALVSLAVTAGQSSRLDGIPDGDYQLYYTTGRDWVAELNTFSRYCDFHQFAEPTAFRATPTQGGTAYTVHTVTIAPAPTEPEPNPEQPPDQGPEQGGEPSPGFTEIPPTDLPR